jgi:tetratricopeptide (TPR) repeat protein
MSYNEESSVELLTESLKTSTEEAIPLLQKALALASNNLSAAEYLSFLLLEKSHPMECIKVCNNIIEQL